VRELENTIERAVILSDAQEITHEQLHIDLELVNVSQIRSSRSTRDDMLSFEATPENPMTRPAQEASEDLSLEDYFQRFVLEHQDSMSETELARKLGVSRKCLWERRQRLGIPRKKAPKQA
jgi:DNA-binding NtrC family response regulator